MSTRDDPPAVDRGAASDPGGISHQGNPGNWPASLTDGELAALVRQLDSAVRVSAGLPDVDHELIHAAALARLELRRRRARRRVAEARSALSRAGWSR